MSVVPVPVAAQDTQQFLRQGIEAGKSGRFSEAEQLFRQVIEINPKLANAYYNMGIALYEQGKWDEAIGAYRQAIAINPKLANAYNNMGNALYEQGKWDEAIGAYRQAIAINPKLANAYNGLGNALYEQGKWDEAIAAFRQAIEINPKYAAAYYNMGNALDEQGQWDEAIAAFRQAIEINPKDAAAYNNMGIVLRKQGQWDEAIGAYRQAIEINPKDAAAYNNMGNVLRDQGKWDEAIGAYRQALKLPDHVSGSPTTAHTQAHNNLGRLLQEQGKLDEAERQFEAALKIDPKFTFARNNLVALQKLKREPILLSYRETRYLQLEDPLTSPKRSIVLLTPLFSPDGRGNGGTGLVIKRKGNKVWILTNRHIVVDEWNRTQPRTSDSVEVLFYLGQKPGNARIEGVKGQVLHISDDIDIALVELDVPDLPADVQPPALNLSPTDNLPVKVIGHPEDDEWRDDDGKVIDISPTEINLKISLEFGNSGSPVFDRDHQVIGVITKIAERDIGFAIPMPRIIQQLQEWGIILP